MSGTSYNGQISGAANDIVPTDPQAGYFAVQRVLDPTGLPTGLYEEVVVTAQPSAAGNTIQLALNPSGQLWTRRSVDLVSTWSSWQQASSTPQVLATAWRVADEKASGTGGGNASNGVNTRALNTIDSTGPLPGNVTLAANQITVQPGRYTVSASAPAVANVLGGLQHACYLYDVTNATTAIRGSSEGSAAILNVQTRSMLQGEIAPVAPTVYELRHFFTSALTGGLGIAVGQAGQNEVYSSMLVTQLP